MRRFLLTGNDRWNTMWMKEAICGQEKKSGKKNTKSAALLSLCLLGGLLVGLVAFVGCSEPTTPNAPGGMIAMTAEAIPGRDLAPGIQPYFGIRVNGTEAQPTYGFKDRWGRLHCQPWYTMEEAQQAAALQWRIDSRLE